MFVNPVFNELIPKSYSLHNLCLVRLIKMSSYNLPPHVLPIISEYPKAILSTAHGLWSRSKCLSMGIYLIFFQIISDTEVPRCHDAKLSRIFSRGLLTYANDSLFPDVYNIRY